MEAYAGDWIQLLLRWVHLITGVAWIGSSFYFVWLDNSLHAPLDQRDGDKGIGGELWAVHGGGFYQVHKYRVAPAVLPETLHWFKWEAYWTWMSGFALLVALYYVHADSYLVDRSVANIAGWQAVAISVVLLLAGWLFYDQLCKRAGFGHERWVGVAMIVFVGIVAYGLSHVFSGRGLYIQVGAMLGTIMVGNVRFVIIPSQRALVSAKQRGEAPDPIHGQRGKQRSIHNNYFTLPVLFLMISNHYPMTYGHDHAWLIMMAMLLLAAFVRHFFNLRHKGRIVWAIPAAAMAATIALAIAIAPTRNAASAAPEFAQVQAIVSARCVSCHAHTPVQAGIASAPKDVLLDSPAAIRVNAPRIQQQAVASRAMPLGNITGMTQAERDVLGAWFARGAP